MRRALVGALGIASALQRSPRGMASQQQQRACALSKSAETIADYDAVAAAFDAGNRDHDVSQNLDALLTNLDGGVSRPVVVDLGCAGGRDLAALAARGCDVWGVDGSAAFCALARAAAPAATVLQQDLCDLDLPAGTFDGVFANAALFHVPSEHLPALLARIHACLKPGGVFFCSNAQGFDEDREGWTGGRTPATRSWVCWLTAATWNAYCEAAGFALLDTYLRGRGGAFLATVWRRP